MPYPNFFQISRPVHVIFQLDKLNYLGGLTKKHIFIKKNFAKHDSQLTLDLKTAPLSQDGYYILPKLSGENPNCPHMFHQTQERLVREKEAPQQITSLDNQEASF